MITEDVLRQFRINEYPLVLAALVAKVYAAEDAKKCIENGDRLAAARSLIRSQRLNVSQARNAIMAYILIEKDKNPISYIYNAIGDRLMFHRLRKIPHLNNCACSCDIEDMILIVAGSDAARLVEEKEYIRAIKLIRDETGWGLKDSKHAVDIFRERGGALFPSNEFIINSLYGNGAGIFETAMALFPVKDAINHILNSRPDLATTVIQASTGWPRKQAQQTVDEFIYSRVATNDPEYTPIYKLVVDSWGFRD